MMDIYKRKLLTLEWFYHWIDQGASYHDAISQTLFYLKPNDEYDEIIIPVTIAERFARNYKPLSAEFVKVVRKAIQKYEDLQPELLKLSDEDYTVLKNDVDEVKKLILFWENH